MVVDQLDDLLYSFVSVTNRASETPYSLAAYHIVLFLTHVDLARSRSIGQTAVGLTGRSAISLRRSIAHSAFSSIATSGGI